MPFPKLKILKVSVLPSAGSITPNTLYFLNDPNDSTKMSAHFSSNDGTTIRSLDSSFSIDIVNDLTTGGADKAGSAEQLKVLKELIDTKYTKPVDGIPYEDLEYIEPLDVPASRNIAASDDGLILRCQTSLTLTIPSGLILKEGIIVECGIGNTITIAVASGVTVNDQLNSITRTHDVNQAGFVIRQLDGTDIFGVSGFGKDAALISNAVALVSCEW